MLQERWVGGSIQWASKGTGMSDKLWVSLSHVPHVEGTTWVKTPRGSRGPAQLGSAGYES